MSSASGGGNPISRLSIAPLLGLAGGLASIGLAAVFAVPRGNILPVQFLLAGIRPELGLVFLLLSVSYDHVVQLLGFFVSLSEFQLAFFLLGCLLWLCRLESHARSAFGENWGEGGRAARVGLPWLGAILLSGVAAEGVLHGFLHLLRNSESFLLLVAVVLVAKRLPDRWLKGAIPLALVFYLSVGLYWNSSGRDVPSAFGNANQFAGYLNLLAPFLASFAFFSHSRGMKQAWAGAAGICVIGLWMTSSRAGLLAALAGSIAGLVLLRTTSSVRRRSIQIHPLAILAGLILVTISWGFLLGSLRQISREASLEAVQPWKLNLSRSFEMRATVFSLGVELWKENPVFGLGPGNYGREIGRYSELLQETFRDGIEREVLLNVEDPADRPGVREALTKGALNSLRNHVHSLPLQVLVDYGVVGLAAFAVLLSRLFTGLLRFPVRSEFDLAAWILLVAVLTHNLFDVTFPSLGHEMGLLLGILWARISAEDGRSLPDPAPR